jgi:hypothetical protein
VRERRRDWEDIPTYENLDVGIQGIICRPVIPSGIVPTLVQQMSSFSRELKGAHRRRVRFQPAVYYFSDRQRNIFMSGFNCLPSVTVALRWLDVVLRGQLSLTCRIEREQRRTRRC